MSAKTELLEMFDEFVTEEDKKTSDILMMLSNEIIKCRLDMNMTQKQFAEFLEYSQSMISKIESEEYNFTIGKLVNIFSKLEKDIEITVKSKIQPKLNVQTQYKLDTFFDDHVSDIYRSKIYRENREITIARNLNNIICTESNKTRYC